MKDPVQLRRRKTGQRSDAARGPLPSPYEIRSTGRLEAARGPPLARAGGTCLEKGRAGGRARRPARPLAWDRPKKERRRHLGWMLKSKSPMISVSLDHAVLAHSQHAVSIRQRQCQRSGMNPNRDEKRARAGGEARRSFLNRNRLGHAANKGATERKPHGIFALSLPNRPF